MKAFHARVAVVLALTLATLAGAPAVLAYDGQIASHIAISGECPAPTTTGTRATVTTALAAPVLAAVTATVVDNAGNPVPGVVVTWSIDGVVQGTATTDANGVARALLALPNGETMVVATVDGIEGRALVVCPTGGVGGVIGGDGGLPRTDTAPAGVPLGIALVALLGLLLASYTVRRAVR